MSCTLFLLLLYKMFPKIYEIKLIKKKSNFCCLRSFIIGGVDEYVSKEVEKEGRIYIFVQICTQRITGYK